MHKVTFFPVGNADSCMVDLRCGEKLLFDFGSLVWPQKSLSDIPLELNWLEVKEITRSLSLKSESVLLKLFVGHPEKYVYHKSCANVECDLKALNIMTYHLPTNTICCPKAMRKLFMEFVLKQFGNIAQKLGFPMCSK